MSFFVYFLLRLDYIKGHFRANKLKGVQMKLIINGFIKQFQNIKDKKTKIKLNHLDLRGAKEIKLFG